MISFLDVAFICGMTDSIPDNPARVAGPDELPGDAGYLESELERNPDRGELLDDEDLDAAFTDTSGG